MAESLYRPLRPVGTGPGQLSVQERMDRNILAKFQQNPLQDDASTPPVSATLLRQTPHVKKPVTDADLLSSMAKRLASLESDLAASRSQVQQLQAENSRLKAHQASPSDDSHPVSPSALPPWQQQAVQLQQETARLRSQCRMAWATVAQMKDFLQDYGMIWVGETDQQQQQQQHEERAPRTPPPAAAAPAGGGAKQGLPFDLQQLASQLQELNTLAGEGASKLVPLYCPTTTSSSSKQQPGPYTLQEAPAVKLWLFADGLQLHSCPPQPYSSAAAAAVVQDILDGYYPAALKQEFPDGVVVQMVDCTAQSMAQCRGSSVAAPGPRSQQQFLQQLPATVIRDGRIISIREGVASFIAGGAAGSSRMVVPDAAAVGAAAAGECGGGGGRATVQVKDEGGQRTYVLAMRCCDTIGELRRRIDGYRAAQGGGVGGAGQAGYEIRSAFPARLYGDDGATLEQAGLVPTATLFLRATAQNQAAH